MLTFLAFVGGCVVCSAALAVVFRRHLKRGMRVAKMLATDPRLPRSLRWLIGVGIAVKCAPVPDFGVDEVALGVAAVWLWLRHRETVRSIIAETR